MKKNITKKIVKNQVSLGGLLTVGNLDNGLRVADFMCSDDVTMEPFASKCMVQSMRDGNLYITELPKRTRNRAIFREDNCSLTRGKNGRWYFTFSMPEERLTDLPAELVRQASVIAGKVMRGLNESAGSEVIGFIANM